MSCAIVLNSKVSLIGPGGRHFVFIIHFNALPPEELPAIEVPK